MSGSKEYNLAFHRAIRKYGFENVEWQILNESLTKEQANMWERLWIFVEPNKYNETEGGENPPIGRHNMPHSEETKRKISENKIRAENISKALKGKPKSEEHRIKIKNSRKGMSSPNKGRKFSLEHRLKLSESHKRRNGR